MPTGLENYWRSAADLGFLQLSSSQPMQAVSIGALLRNWSLWTTAPVHNIRTDALGRALTWPRSTHGAATPHPEARRDRGARDRSARGPRDVSGDRGSLTGGRAVDVVAPRPLGRARSTLRATLRVAPAAPSSRSACGGLRLLVPRPVRQLSVGASRAVSSRPDQDPSALRALRCGSSLGPVVPRRRSRPLSRALCRTGRGNGWQDTCSVVPPVPASAPVPGGSR